MSTLSHDHSIHILLRIAIPMRSSLLKQSTTFLLLTVLLIDVSTAWAQRGGGGMNAIDRCWRGNWNWASDRQRLAMCSVGFAGKMTNNIGRGLRWYTVTDPGDDPLRPRLGTLRYGATMIRGKVWIDFKWNMVIKLRAPLLIKSYTAIDGRGAKVEIAYGAGFMMDEVTDVIVHGLHFHNCQPQWASRVMGPGGKVLQLGNLDGDAIRMVGSTKIWIDHNTFSRSQDGLLDVTRGSTDITISNNWFSEHDKVMLLGHDDGYFQDRRMRVTLAYNRFGPRVNQRMPRIRHGYAHVVNNLYDGWGSYAIGGSSNPSIRSEANLFVAPRRGDRKDVTWREGGSVRGWNWRSVGDAFVNGAYFTQTGRGGAGPAYGRGQRFPVRKASAVRSLTRNAGALTCYARSRC